MERITPNTTIRILGLDPGLTHTGWGVIESAGNMLRYIASGRISSDAKSGTLAERLNTLYIGLKAVIETHQPDEAAVEETFVNKNALSALKLGMARGIVLLAPAHAGLEVAEYSANRVKKSISSYGHAEKEQVARMVKVLLPTAQLTSADAADALAIAICHAHYRLSNQQMEGLRA